MTKIDYTSTVKPRLHKPVEPGLITFDGKGWKVPLTREDNGLGNGWIVFDEYGKFLRSDDGNGRGIAIENVPETPVLNLKQGDQVRVLWCTDREVIAHVVDSPLNPEWVMIVYLGINGGPVEITYARTGHEIDYDGKPCKEVDVEIYVKPDPAKEAWDKLDPEVRRLLLVMGRRPCWQADIGDYGLGKPIPAIKQLRHLTGLGLVDAKRAIEEFTV